MFGAFDISTSALSAQQMRLQTIASNIASIDVVQQPDGRNVPYRRLYPMFQSQRTGDGGLGVRVSSIEEDQSPFLEKIEPGSPAADPKTGIVRYPNIKLSTEMANAIETTRAYEANIAAIETTKSMMNATLRVLA